MERELIEEDAPPRVGETPVEAPARVEEDRLEQLLRGVVHTLLATYRLRERSPRRGAASRLRRHRRLEDEGMCC